jgi:hypothetical protein
MSDSPKTFSRRTVLIGGTAAVAAVGLAGTARAQDKIAKEAVMYQDQPKGDQRCDNCLHWQPPNACAIVAGDIAPEAWCGVWAPQSS